MTTPSLFDHRTPGRPTPRPYQVEAVEAVFREFDRVNSTLVVMATGTGKTPFFGFVADRWLAGRPNGRVLVLAHTEELVFQPRDELAPILGFAPEVEMADHRASPAARCVLASVQSLSGPARLADWPRDHFDLVVWDEAHHKVRKNRSYWSVREHFASAKHLGVTATADRTDRVGLGESFESVAYDYGIRAAVEGGWLVPVEQEFAQVTALDVSAVGSSGPELNLRQLSAAMTGDGRVSAEIAAAVLEKCGTEPTLVFTCPRPKGEPESQGEQVARWLNDIKPGCAAFLTGGTPRDVRRRELARFEAGGFHVLVGCNLFLEGFNQPKISRVVMARPTKSRALYEQMLGRGTRPLRGLLTPDLNDAPAEARRAVIAASPKPRVVVVDLIGNSGRHKLVSCVDIFAGKASPAAVTRATKKAKAAAKPVEVLSLVAEAEAEVLSERKARVKVRVEVRCEAVDPFGGTDGASRGGRPGGRAGDRATPVQREWVERYAGEKLPAAATIAEAGAVIADVKRRWAEHLCTRKQERVLKRAGAASGPVPKAHAKALIDLLAARGWVPMGYDLTRDRLGIKPVPREGGYKLTVADPTVGRVAVGGVYASPDDVRKAYRGLAAEPAAA